MVVILLVVFIIIAITFGLVAYTSNNRKRAGQKDIPAVTSEKPAERRAPGND